MQKNNKNPNNGCGLFISILVSFFNSIGKMINSSFIVSLFTNFITIRNSVSQSKSSGIISKCSKLKHGTLKFKNRCARYAEQSVIMNIIDTACANFFRTSLRSIGIFLLSSGGIIVAACLANYTDNIVKLNFSDTFIFGAITLLSSFFFIPKKGKNVSDCIHDSCFLSFFFIEIFYVKHLEKSDSKKICQASALAFVLGIALGSLSYAVSPIIALFILGAIAYLYLIFTKPENGILLICMQLPLLSKDLLEFLIASTAVSLVFKIIRGKRAFNMNICSWIIVIWGIVTISCSLFTFDRNGAATECFPFLMSLLLALCIILTVRSSSLSDKCFRMLGVSVILSLFIGLSETVVNAVSGNDILQSFKDIFIGGFRASFNSTESCAAFLVAAMPFFVVKNQIKSKIFSFPILALAVLCLVMCGSFHAVLALFISLLVSMAIFSRHGIITAIIAAIAGLSLPKAIVILTGSKLTGLNAVSDASYKSIYQLLKFFSEYGICGTGFGRESIAYSSFEQGINASHIQNGFGVYVDFAMKLGIPLLIVCIISAFAFISKIVTYALEKYKSEFIKSKCIALFSSLLGLAVFAFFSDYLYDFRMLALLFLILGLSSAITDSADADYISQDRYPEYEIL